MHQDTTNAGSDGLLTAKQLAARIPGFPVPTIYRMSAKQLIPAVAVGACLGGVRFIESDVRAALANLKWTPRVYRGKKTATSVA